MKNTFNQSEEHFSSVGPRSRSRSLAQLLDEEYIQSLPNILTLFLAEHLLPVLLLLLIPLLLRFLCFARESRNLKGGNVIGHTLPTDAPHTRFN